MQRIAWGKWVVVVPIVAVLALSVLVTQTSPDSIGPAGILLVFVLLYIFFASVLFIVLHAGEAMLRMVMGEERVARMPRWSFEVKKAYYLASVLAFVPVALLAMQSLGQLQVRDIALVGVLALLVSFYVLRIAR